MNNTDILIEKQENDFNPIEVKENLQNTLRHSPEVQKIISSTKYEMNDVIYFGEESSKQLSEFSGKLLNNVKSTEISESTELLNRLGKILKEVDINEIQKEPSKISKIFSNGKKRLDKLINKCSSIGKDLDAIQIELLKSIDEINKSNKQLEELFSKNLEYFKELEKYIVAGEVILEKLENEEIPKYLEIYNQTQDNVDQLKYSSLIQYKNIMEQRINDLRTAETVALQTLPSVKTIQVTNFLLMCQLNSSIIVGLPAFKNNLVIAINTKKQYIQQESYDKYKQTVNNLILSNSKNIANQAKKAAAESGNNFIEVSTLEESWNTLYNGILESKELQKEATQKRIENTKKLEQLQNEIKKNM